MLAFVPRGKWHPRRHTGLTLAVSWELKKLRSYFREEFQCKANNPNLFCGSKRHLPGAGDGVRLVGRVLAWLVGTLAWILAPHRLGVVTLNQHSESGSRRNLKVQGQSQPDPNSEDHSCSVHIGKGLEKTRRETGRAAYLPWGWPLSN